MKIKIYRQNIVVRKKTNFLVIHNGTNDLTNSVNTMKEIKKLVRCVKDLDKDKDLNIGFLSVISRFDRNLDQEIRDINLKLKRYCEGNNFLFVDNVNVEESCLNNSKLHLNHKGTNILSKYQKFNLPYSSSVTNNREIDITKLSLSKDIDQILFDLKSNNPSKLNFIYLNINSVSNKFVNFKEILNGKVIILQLQKPN